MKKRAYIFVNIEIATWNINLHQRHKIGAYINQVIQILKGQFGVHHETTYSIRLLEAVRSILYLTEISLDDMMEVLDKVRNDINEY